MTQIRWKQRFNNYVRAIRLLQKAAAAYRQQAGDSDLLHLSLAKSFEISFELSINILKDFIEFQDGTKMTGSRDIIRTAFKKGLIGDGELWIKIIENRNKTAHIYNDQVAAEVMKNIMERYLPAFEMLEKDFSKYYEQENG